MSSERECVRCSSQIGSLRGPKTQFCSSACRLEFEKAKRQKCRAHALSNRSTQAGKKGRVVLHSCIYSGGAGLDPWTSCKCRKSVSHAEANRMVVQGEAIRRPLAAGAPDQLVLISKLKKSPRAALIDRAHLDRAYGGSEENLKQDVEKITKLAAEDKTSHEQEEKLRFEVLDGLQFAFLNKLKRVVPADEFDREEAENRGRPFIFATIEQRTTISRDTSSLSFDDDDEVPEPPEPNESPKDVPIEVEDLRSAEEVLQEFKNTAAA